MRVSERENQSGENVTLKIGADGGRHLSFSGTTKDNPTCEDIRAMLDRIYANAVGFCCSDKKNGDPKVSE